MLSLLAQVVIRDQRGWWQGGISNWGFAEFAAAIVIVAGLIAVVAIALRKLGLTFPDWAWQIGVVVVVVLVALFAIRMIANM